jgi:Beta propeller domain
MQRSRIVRSAVTVTALTLAAAGGAYALNERSTTPAPTSPRVGLAAYRSFSGCDDLLSYLRTQALPLVGPFGLEGSPDPGGPTPLRELAPGAVPPAGTAAADGVAVVAGSANAGEAGATSDTGTNVQVAGVDEADVTKKSGDLELTVGAGAGTGLTVLRAADRQVRVVGRLATDWRPEQLLVRGTTVLLLGTVPEDRRPGPIPAPTPGGTTRLLPVPTDQPRARVAEVDVADPAHPRLVRTLDLDGGLVGARLADGVVRLAVAATPSRLPFVRPQAYTAPGDPQVDAGVRAAVQANRKVVQTAPVADWLPRWTLTPASGRASSGTLLDCARVGVPAEFSGLGTLSMLTFDLRSGGVDRWQGAGVVASGSTLYSTGDHTYVATRPWALRVLHPEVSANGPARPDLAIRTRPQTTIVHTFETSAAGVRYLGSGTVQGTLLGQYAMDEYQGMLRVASTVRPDVVPGPQLAPGSVSGEGGGGGSAGSGPRSGPGASADARSEPVAPTVSSAPAPTLVRPVPRPTVLPPMPRPTVVRPVPAAPSSGSVTVLRLAGGALEQVGRLDGLGKDEAVQGVRFAGPLAYVVTFRQTDPLFVVDLADPAHPRVAGSVGLLGYSAYLHPLGNGLLLGVGQDATADGGRTGLLMSLFDVSNPAAPRLLDRVTLPGAWAQVESDTHAFTYADGLALVPLEPGLAVASSGGSGSGAPGGADVLAVRVQGGRLGAPSVLHVDAGRGGAGVDPLSMRTFVDGGSIWSVAPGTPQGVAAVHDESSLTRVAATTF